MPNPNALECNYCKSRKDISGEFCSTCWDLKNISLDDSNILKTKAEKLIEAIQNDIITKELYITKRDMLLHLQKISRDKYLTKLKDYVDKL